MKMMKKKRERSKSRRHIRTGSFDSSIIIESGGVSGGSFNIHGCAVKKVRKYE